MPAKQDERTDIPAHDKHADRHADQGSANGIDITQVFRRQVQGVGAKRMHKATIDRTEQDEPKKQEHLVFPEMQEQQLYGKRINKPFQPGLHERNNL